MSDAVTRDSSLLIKIKMMISNLVQITGFLNNDSSGTLKVVFNSLIKFSFKFVNLQIFMVC